MADNGSAAESISQKCMLVDNVNFGHGLGTLKPVAVLCASRRSVYKGLARVDVYDRERDARTFRGGMPVIGHPPCRGWMARWAWKAKPEPGELQVGIWVAEQVRKNGGILEQPANSGLWAASGLPLPGEKTNAGWSISVPQFWWGYPTLKKTWLFFSGIERNQVVWPFRLYQGGDDKRIFECMSHEQRSATTLEFANWLVDHARKARVRERLP